jgi:PAS domain S-box-containing protein
MSQLGATSMNFHASEGAIRALFEHSADAMLILDGALFVDCNPAATRLMKCTRDELLNAPPERLSPEFQPDGQSSANGAAQFIQTAYEKGSNLFEWVHRRPNGEEFFVEVSITVVPFENRQVLFTVWRDITNRKKVDAVLRESEESYRNLFDSLQDGMFVIQKGVVVLINSTLETLTGYTLNELIGESFTKVIAPEDEALVTNNYRKRLAGEPLPDEYVIHILQKDGQTRIPVNLRATTISYNGQPAVIGSLRNISDKTRMEQELHEREEQYRVLFNSQQDGVFVVQDGKLQVVNQALAQMLDYETTEMIGFTFPDFILAEDAKQVAENYRKRMAGEPAPDEYIIHMIKKGGLAQTLANIRPFAINYRGRSATMGTARNVTEQMRMEQELRDSRLRLQESYDRRGLQVKVSNEIAQEIAAAPAVNELINRVVVLVKERFEYYHTQLLRYEPALNAVVLVKGYGEIGEKMLAAGHRMEMGRGLIGSAAAMGQTIMRPEVVNDPDWRPNPLLPETQGEIAVPVKYGDRVLGVLDVQSNQAGALTDDDRLLLEGLCGQIAIALEGTRLRQEMQERLNELNKLYAETARGGWANYRATNKLPAGYVFDRTEIHPSETVWVNEIEQAILQKNLVPAASADSAAVAPLAVRGEVIGALGIYDDPQRKLTEADLSLIEQVSDQVALALESARLFEQTSIALDEAEKLYNFSRKLAEAPDLDGVINAVIEASGIPQLNRGTLVTFEYDENGAMHGGVVKAIWYSGQGIPPRMAVGARFDQQYVNGMFKRFQSQQPVFQSEINPEIHKRGIFSAAVLPLWVGNLQVGILLLETDEVYEFSEDDKRPMSALSQQTAITVQSRLLFEQVLASESVFRTTSQQLVEALNSARMANWEFDVASGTFVFNEVYYQFLETTLEEEGSYLMPAPVFAQKYVHPEDAQDVGAHIQEALQTPDLNYRAEFEARLRRPDGTYRSAVVSLRVEKDAQGNTVRMYGTNQDISARKQAEEAVRASQTQLQAVVDNMPVAVIAKDVNGRFVMWNKSAENIFGFAAEVVLGKTDHDFYPKEQADFFLAKDMEAINARQIVDIPEEPVTTKDRGLRLLHTTKVPIYDAKDQPLYLLVVSEDITDRKQAQETIAKRAVELAMVAEITTRVSTIQSPDEMLQTVVDLTKQAFNLYHVQIYMLNEPGDTLVIARGAGEIGHKMVSEGRRISLDAEKSLAARAARNRQGVIVNNVHQDPDFLPHPLLTETCSEMAVPMIAGGRLLGVIDVQDSQYNRFTPEDVNIMTTLAAQIAVSLQNARSYARAQRQAEREALINAISERIQATNSVESALQVAVREIGRALGAQHTAIRLGLERKADGE